MDFQKFKEGAQKFTATAKKAGKQALEYSVSQLADSKMTLKTLEELEAFQLTSKNTSIKNTTTGKKKEFTHRSLVIFADTSSSFFQQMLYIYPVLQTKAFSQNIKLKLADISMKGLHKSSFKISNVATLLVFENTKVYKVIEGEEKIQKIVKSLSLDINKVIEEL